MLSPEEDTENTMLGKRLANVLDDFATETLLAGSRLNRCMGVGGREVFTRPPYLETGRLKEVLTNARCSPLPVSIVYASGRNASAATRAFVEWIAASFDENDFNPKNV
jgi:DNA-binding transcriptional LysR family regulator